jgi:hypothetical protein
MIGVFDEDAEGDEIAALLVPPPVGVGDGGIV